MEEGERCKRRYNLHSNFFAMRKRDINKMYDIYILLVLASFGLILSVSYIYFFLANKKLHKSPGDIYLGMSIGEGLYSLK